MSNRTIGRLVNISSRSIVAEINHKTGNYINTLDGIRFVGEIGSYVYISDIDRKIIAEVIAVEDKNISGIEKLSKPQNSRFLNLNLVGEIFGDKFSFGVSKMPLIFSEICIITENDLKIMLEIDRETEEIDKERNITRAIALPIGQSVIFPDYKVRVNIDCFFGFHFAVFGNTGAGKSNTVARVIQNVFQKENYSARGAKFIVIDSNGEYEAAFTDLKNNNDNIDAKFITADVTEAEQKPILEIPVWALSADDWAVLLHASEKTQIPIIRRAIDIARVFFDPDNNDDSLKNHILGSTIIGILNSSDSSPSKCDKVRAVLSTFKTQELNLDTKIAESNKIIRDMIKINFGEMKDIEALIIFCEKMMRSDINDEFVKPRCVVYDLKDFSEAIKFAVLYEGSISSQRIQEYTATLTTRLQALMDSDQGKILVKTNFDTLDAYVTDLIGSSQVLNVDVSCLDDSSCEVVAKVITKVLLDYLKKQKPKASMPINLVIEEGHRFIKNEASFGALGYNIFERVAKEGRKYGLLLGISSQRPSELSKTVVSQCSNFIIHRVQNPDDLAYISRMVPYISEGIIDRLTYLQTGHALVFGTAINLPTLTKFERAKPQTDGQNAQISKKWYIQ